MHHEYSIRTATSLPKTTHGYNTYRGWTQTGYLNKYYNINQKDEDTLDDRGRDGGTNFILRIQVTGIKPDPSWTWWWWWWIMIIITNVIIFIIKDSFFLMTRVKLYSNYWNIFKSYVSYNYIKRFLIVFFSDLIPY